MQIKRHVILMASLSFSLSACAPATYPPPEQTDHISPQEILDDYGTPISDTDSIYRYHTGIDAGMPRDVIIAAADGTVDYVASSGNSELVIIYHGRDHDGLHMRTTYAYHRELFVKEGDPVVRGQEIGIVGGLKRSHLHFGVAKAPENLFGISSVWIPENPHDYWIDGPEKIACFQSKGIYPQKPPVKLTWPLKCR